MARRSWDQQSILKKLRALHRAGKEMSYTRLAKLDQSLVSAAAYHFGSYRKAAEKAGLDYAEVSRRPRWTRQLIISLIKDAKRKGYDLHWSAVTKRRDELGRAAFASLQKRLFGSWDRALSASGLDADDIARYRKWDRDSILYELKARAREGEPLNSGAIQKEDPGLHAAAVRHFGSYDDALRRAKVNPALVRKRRRWDRQQVIRELRAFKRKHKDLSDGLLRKQAPALYGAALRLFRNIASAKTAAQ